MTGENHRKNLAEPLNLQASVTSSTCATQETTPDATVLRRHQPQRQMTMTAGRNHQNSWTLVAEQAGRSAATLPVYPLRF